MRKLFNILMAGIFALSSIVPLAIAGDTTSNGYFYLPSYGATGSSERTSWFNSLEATDAVIGNVRSASYIVQTPSSTLSGEQALSSLATGIVYNTNATGVLSIATPNTDYEPALTNSASLASTLSDETGSGLAVFDTSPTLTTPTISGAISFPDGVRQTFNPNATTAGLNIGSVAGDPSSPIDGDMWYDSSGGKFRCRQAGATQDCGSAGGGGGGSGTVNTGVLGYFGYYPANGTTVDDQTVLFTDGTSIGIGTTSPTGLLNVVGGHVRVGSGGTNTNATSAGELYVQNDLEVDGTAYLATVTEGGNAVPNTTELDTSSEIAGIVGDETGSGALVFGTSPTFTTNLTTPLILGGTGVGSGVEVRSTTGTGSSDFVKLTVGTNGGTEGLRVISNGNVGIGTATPSTKLQVQGGARITGLANCDTIDTDANGVLTCGSDAGGANGWTDDGTVVRLGTSTDNIGIGTTAPVGKFEVKGDADAIQATITGNSTQTSDIFNVRKSDGTMLFTVENTNVGIGTANPTAKFSVGTTSQFQVDASGNATAATVSVTGTGQSVLNQGLVINENGGATASDILRVEGDTDANLLYTSVSNDRIGIGTTTPGAKFTVEQTAAVDSFRVNDAAADTTPFVIDQSGNVAIGATSASSLLAVGSSGQFTVDSSGNAATTASLTVPNGANPSVASAGRLSVDTSSGAGGMFRYYDSAERALPAYQTKSFVVTGATTSSDFPVWKVPYAITIRAIHVLVVGGTNVVGGLDETDGNGGSASAIDSDITGSAGTNANDDGTLTNPTLDSGDYLYWHTTSVSGTNTTLTVTFEYTVDPVN